MEEILYNNRHKLCETYKDEANNRHKLCETYATKQIPRRGGKFCK